MKKRVMLGAGLCLAISVMISGCGKVTAEKLLAEATENSRKASSVAGDMEMNMGMEVGQGGFSIGLELGMSGDFEATNEPAAFHMDGTMNMSLLNMSFDMESYSMYEGEKVTSYTKVADTWTKIEGERDAETAKNSSMLPVFHDGMNLTLAEEMEKVNDQDSYVITTTLTGDDLKGMMESSGEMLDMDEIDMEKADFTEVSADVVMKIYEKSKLPAAMSVEFTEGLESLMDTEEEASAKLNKLNVTLNFKEYNTVDKIEVPQEALDAKVNSPDAGSIFDNALNGGAIGGEAAGAGDALSGMLDNDTKEPPMDEEGLADSLAGLTEDAVRTEDGAYVLTDYEKDVRVEIKIPEGFTDEDSYLSSTNISFMQTLESGNNAYVSYSVEEITDYNTEDMVYSYFEDTKDYYEERGNYEDIEFQAPMDIKAGDRDVKYASLSYRDGSYGTYEQRFWLKVDERHLLECQLYESTYESEPTITLEKNAGELVLSGVSLGLL